MTTVMERAPQLDAVSETSSRGALGNALLASGIAASVLYVAADLIGALIWNGYSLKTFTISELSAIDAPSRPVVPALMLVFGALSLAFAVGVLNTGRGRGLRVTGCLLVAVGVANLAGPFVPMHLRGTEGSLTDTMHIATTAVTSVLLALAIWFGRKAFGRGFRKLSLVILAIMIGFGALAAAYGPAIAANDPTPWVGVTERICIGAYLLWMAALSGALLCTPDQTKESARSVGSPSAMRSQRTPASGER